jgi:toxin ParE1/3/4
MPRYDVRAKADQDVDQIAEYIGSRNATAGRNFILAARREFEFLGENPLAGTIRLSRRHKAAGLRSWPIKGYRNYLILYLPTSDGVEIVRVLHGARDIDTVLAEDDA